MKKANKLNSAVLVATLVSGSIGGLTAFAQTSPSSVAQPPLHVEDQNRLQQADTPPPVNNQPVTSAPITTENQAPAPIHSDDQQRLQQSTLSANSSAEQPMCMVNKGSKLIGATVKNPQGETLGKIDDVVVDYNTGRISYAALEVKGAMFSKGKYLAVPLAAFRPSEDGSSLILNADREKIAQAQGFDRNNWPAINNPSWGAQPFWQNPDASTPSSQPRRSSQTKNLP
jgi:hypothetical protein